MVENTDSPSARSEAIAGYVVWTVAVAIALVSARDYAGGWNDGSRLATVECLVDHHTLAIDESIFVDVPRIDPRSDRPFPYPLDDPAAWIGGTKDKVLVAGRYYSHKPPIPAVLLAGWYFIWQKVTGLTARARCDEFCYWMTLGSSGVAYVASVVGAFHLGGLLRLSLAKRLQLALSLALATVSIAYVRHVNDHIMLLGVATVLTFLLAQFAKSLPQAGAAGRSKGPELALAGSLAGLAYTIDQGAGPPLLVAAAAIVAYRARRRVSALAIFGVAAVPWLAAHHAINYALGGTFKPIGSVPEYFDWPGSPFNADNMTGVWRHESLGDLVLYALGLLFSPRWGFFWHNLPLLLLLPGAFALWRRRPAESPEAAALGGWCFATWLLYAALSVNHSGDCCSVRWFVPLLAAGYFMLAVLLRDEPRYHWGFAALSALGLGLGAMMWAAGPWAEPSGPSFSALQAAGAACWIGWMMWAAWPRRPADHKRRARRIPEPI
ncbi:MAG TPA: hypothetical protein VGN42_24685 [Pirellulales bacterium]|jgi:hypothetical protein|nr:hypothetical protein [Pirellulales bacterium]